ncbi:MAG: 2-hydroxyacid dehydrogenase [Candidatus Thorarchaeota archaeon]
MKDRIFVTRNIPGKGLKLLSEKFEVDVWEKQTPPTREQIVDRAQDAIGVVTLLSDVIDKKMIQSLPKLKVISQYAVGYDNIDISSSTERGIIVTNTPGILTETTADLTWALIMATSRRIVEADNYVRKGNWKVAWGPEMLVGTDVFGATLGIIGLGRIGSAVARRAKGFRMKVIYTSRTESNETKEIEQYVGARRVELETLLSKADIVTIHLPLTDVTRNLIGEKMLKIMKEGSILINTARGPIVNETALAGALVSGHLRAAGLDVFHNEPTPSNNPLLDLQNVVVLPHIGSASISTREQMGEMCAENLIKALEGRMPPNIVNPEVTNIIEN